MNRAPLYAMVLLAFCSSADAAGRVVYGAGAISCAEWQDYRTSGGRVAKLQAESWVDGYLSGFNVGSQTADFLRNKPNDIALYTWLDNYCSTRPLDMLVIAVDRLRDDLVARMPK